jgi:hypothetical protein
VVDWDRKFKAEYDYAKTFLDKPQFFDPDWFKLVKGLDELMGAKGFDPHKAHFLTFLRERCQTPINTPSGAKIDEAHAILKACNLGAEKDNTVVEVHALMRAAALKMLRHTYMITRSGNRHMWVHSLPKAYGDWASDHFFANARTVAPLKTNLRRTSEIFSSKRKQDLSYAGIHSLYWAQTTAMTLANAKSKGAGRASARGLVKRWFADPATTEADLDKFIDSLTLGFKKIISTLNKGHLIFTDWVPLRNATGQDVKWTNAEAFTFRSKTEGLDVVYIENSFFVDHPGNVIKGPRNWTRIVLHELTHLCAGTVDVNKGNARYAWYGIGPHAGFPGTDAVTNADSWAFFAADCVGALSDAERKTALKII